MSKVKIPKGYVKYDKSVHGDVQKVIDSGKFDELCACGHLQSQHGDTIAKGHGMCQVEGCDCTPKFTFKMWLVRK